MPQLVAPLDYASAPIEWTNLAATPEYADAQETIATFYSRVRQAEQYSARLT